MYVAYIHLLKILTYNIVRKNVCYVDIFLIARVVFTFIRFYKQSFQIY